MNGMNGTTRGFNNYHLPLIIIVTLWYKLLAKMLRFFARIINSFIFIYGCVYCCLNMEIVI